MQKSQSNFRYLQKVQKVPVLDNYSRQRSQISLPSIDQPMMTTRYTNKSVDIDPLIQQRFQSVTQITKPILSEIDVEKESEDKEHTEIKQPTQQTKPDYQLIFYPQQIIETIPNLQKERQMSNFVPFSQVFQSNHDWKEEISKLYQTERTFGSTTLKFNSNQIKQYMCSMEINQLAQNKSIHLQQWNLKNRISSMPKIRITKKKNSLDDSSQKPLYERAMGQDITSPQNVKRGSTLSLFRSKKQNKDQIVIQPIKVLKLYITVNSYNQINVNQITQQELLNRPSPREGATLTMCSDKLYLYGGIGKDLDPHIYELQPKDLIWRKLPPPQGEQINTKLGRLGHTALAWKNRILIFGGEKKYNPTLKLRDCLNDTFLYNPKDQSISLVEAYGDIPEPRRNHSSSLLGRFQLVTGGINQMGKVLSQVYTLNLESNKWTVIEMKDFFEQEDGIAFHQTFPVFSGILKMESILLPYEVLPIKGRKQRKFQEEGVYLSGGRQASGNINPNLYVLKLGQKPIICKPLQTRGQAPHPRYMHTINYSEETAQAIVIGGKNDDYGVFADISILDLETLSWCFVECYGFEQYKINLTFKQSCQVLSFQYTIRQQDISFGRLFIQITNSLRYNNYRNSNQQDPLKLQEQTNSRLKIRQQNLSCFYNNKTKDPVYVPFSENITQTQKFRVSQKKTKEQLDKVQEQLVKVQEQPDLKKDLHYLEGSPLSQQDRINLLIQQVNFKNYKSILQDI